MIKNIDDLKSKMKADAALFTDEFYSKDFFYSLANRQ